VTPVAPHYLDLLDLLIEAALRMESIQSDSYAILGQKLGLIENLTTTATQSTANELMQTQIMTWGLMAQGATFGAGLALIFAYMWAKV